MPEVNQPEPAEVGGEQQIGPRVLRTDELFVGQRIIVIEHAGEQYRLMITRNNRLLLQK